jgi:hypothetical protein
VVPSEQKPGGIEYDQALAGRMKLKFPINITAYRGHRKSITVSLAGRAALALGGANRSASSGSSQKILEKSFDSAMGLLQEAYCFGAGFACPCRRPS